MANNRMRIRCIPCDATLTIGKRLGSGYSLPEAEYKGTSNAALTSMIEGSGELMDVSFPRPPDISDRLQAFFDEHEWCDGTKTHGQDKFDLVYEDGINPSYATHFSKPEAP